MVSVSQQTKKQKMEMRNKKIFEKNRNNNQTEKEINMERSAIKLLQIEIRQTSVYFQQQKV